MKKLLLTFCSLLFLCSIGYSQSIETTMMNIDSTTIDVVDLEKRINHTTLSVYKAGYHYDLATKEAIYGFFSSVIGASLVMIAANNQISKPQLMYVPFGVLSVACSISSLSNRIKGNRHLLNTTTYK